MTRDETIALWQKCEKVRSNALKEGKSDRDAHDDAKAVWNGWATALLAERAELLETSRWSAKTAEPRDFSTYAERERGENHETIRWLENAVCDFSELQIRNLFT